MPCKHLHLYHPAGSAWTVASCTAKASPYVPSTSELHAFCRNSRHAGCPAYLFPAPPPQSKPAALPASPAAG